MVNNEFSLKVYLRTHICLMGQVPRTSSWDQHALGILLSTDCPSMLVVKGGDYFIVQRGVHAARCRRGLRMSGALFGGSSVCVWYVQVKECVIRIEEGRMVAHTFNPLEGQGRQTSVSSRPTWNIASSRTARAL